MRPTDRNPRRLTLLAIGLVACLLVVGVGPSAGAATDPDPSSRLRGFVMEPAPQVGALMLPDATRGGAELPLVASPGGLLLVYFGYTSCPDICPTTLSDLAVALRKLGRSADGVDVAMVTVDPERDTGDVLNGYLSHFIKGPYHALRTDDPTRLRVVADGFGARYEVRKQADGEVEVGHSALVYAVDDEGVVRVAWPFGTTPRTVTKDLRLLMRDGSNR